MSNRLLPLACLIVASCVCGPEDHLPNGGDLPTTFGPEPASAAAAVPVVTTDAPAGASNAATLDGVKVLPNRDSARFFLPAFDGAKDFRAFPVGPGVTLINESGTEKVTGTTIYCAGYQQRNAPAQASYTILRELEVAGVPDATDIVIEAIDRPCPFPGIAGQTHVDRKTTINEVPVEDRVAWSIFTAGEIAQRYGSAIVNGHGRGATLAAQGDAVSPKVLARVTVKFTPKDRSTPPLATFFDGFEASDPIVVTGTLDSGGRAHENGTKYENANWYVTSWNGDPAQVFIDRGQLHVTLADWEQDVFSSVVATPKRAAKLDDAKYLKVGYEVASDSSARRYWWLSLCGAETAGQTFTAGGQVNGRIVQTPFFYQDDGKNPSLEKWNCLQIFPRDGWPFDLGPTNSRPQSDIRVMVNKANAPDNDSVINVSPNQFKNTSIAAPSWYLQQDAAGKLGAPMLDEEEQVAPRTRYDVFVRRDRVVMYVNGQQRLCNDFPNEKLTQAETAVGFGQVLYHSAAERGEFQVDYWVRTGQRYYLQNAPYADERYWDNLGFEEKTDLPAGFDASKCFVH